MEQELQTVWGDRLFRSVFVSPWSVAPWFSFAMPGVFSCAAPVALLGCVAAFAVLAGVVLPFLYV